MRLAENFEEILLAFCKHRVHFMIAGGYAVNYHGFSRTTADIDFWVEPDNENKIKIISALKESGFPEEELDQINEIDFEKPFSFKIGMEPVDVDVFNNISGVSYYDAEKNKLASHYGDGIEIYYIGLNDLLINKLIAGRNKDKIDVDELQKIAQQRANDQKNL
jgi:predicted nucleotidyltransferase